jgi:N-acetylmuramoyl-L-alanine amidase
VTKYIALDDGHGMETAGKRTPYIPSLGRQIKENEFNRAVVKFLDQELKRCGFRTLLVAPTDVDTPLKERTDKANKAGVDAYISIHYNAFDGTFAGKNPEGFQAHVYLGHSNKEAGKLAKCILKHLAGGTKQVNRGLFESNFHVLRETHMPAVLLELGFMDNKREALLMIDTNFQKECAREIAQGICEYFGVKYVPEQKVKATAPKITPPKANPPKTTTPTKTFYRVVTGSFKEKANAERRVAELKRKGFDSFIDYNNGWYRVITGSFQDRGNAEKRMAELKRAGFDSFIKSHKA